MPDLLSPLLNEPGFQQNQPEVKIEKLFRYYANNSFANEEPVIIIISILAATRIFLSAAAINHSERRVRQNAQMTLFSPEEFWTNKWEILTQALMPDLTSLRSDEQEVTKEIIQYCHACIDERLAEIKNENPNDPIYQFRPMTAVKPPLPTPPQ